MNLEAIEDALQEWAEDATGVTVIWLDPNTARPTAPYVALNFIELARLSIHDEVRLSFDEDATGEEFEHTLLSPRRGIIRVEACSTSVTGAATARALAAAADSALSLEAVRATLKGAGLQILDRTKIEQITVQVDTAYEFRATFDVVGLIADTNTQRTTYIGTIDLTQEDA